mmetsp:Transcript_33166/g.61152  ORF Transcript_33166/g.61152 Transcript_33166/m.61152 type:complete len:118 (-) Transcript_33166:1484-1837(-)
MPISVRGAQHPPSSNGTINGLKACCQICPSTQLAMGLPFSQNDQNQRQLAHYNGILLLYTFRLTTTPKSPPILLHRRKTVNQLNKIAGYTVINKGQKRPFDMLWNRIIVEEIRSIHL